MNMEIGLGEMNSSFGGQRVCVTGGAGFLGRAVCERLRSAGAINLIVPRSTEFDLTDATDVARLYQIHRPDLVIHLAAEVGGIGANQKRPGRFFFANMAMGLHLIEGARRFGVKKFVQVASVCSYPKHCPVPFKEKSFWDGYPEETNAPYGVAKRALGVMIDAYAREYGLNGIYLVPVNLYGPGDHFDLETSHVIPALIRKFCEAVDSGADRVVCWGTGQVTREFLYVDDAAEAVVRAASVLNEPSPINIGTGEEISIFGLAGIVARLCGYHGAIEWDSSRPDGQPHRRLDTTRAAKLLGWRATVELEEGLRRTIAWWRDHSSQSVAALVGSGTP
ncbi:MAG: GDP-L-fucose synthase [Planctomycetota bacterium]